MNMNINNLITSLVFVLKIFVLNVEARRGDVIPLGHLYDSNEQRHSKNSEIGHHRRDSFEYEKAELPEFKKRKPKKKRKRIKSRTSHGHNYVENEIHNRKKTRKGGKRFVKTILNDTDKDSNFSESDENKKRIKPVDIIVHIKMKD